MSFLLENYKNAGLLGLAIFWLAVVAVVRLHKGKKARSISEHMASAKKTMVAFGAVTLVSTALLVLFFIKWFTPVFGLGVFFNVVVVAMLLLFAVAGFVPDTRGLQHQIHIYAAVAASLLLVPAMGMIIANNHISHIARTFTALATLLMGYVGYKFTASRHTEKQLLIYEAVYFLCFDVSVLVATYIR